MATLKWVNYMNNATIKCFSIITMLYRKLRKLLSEYG